MTAYDVYDGWTDDSNTNQVITGHKAMINDVIAYADGAMDIVLSHEIADKIVKCFEHMKKYSGGNDIDEHYKAVEVPLKEINL